MTVAFFQELVAQFLRARHPVRNFCRLLVLETFPTSAIESHDYR